MPALTLRPMTDLEFQEWQDALARAYADDQIAAGNWPPDDALRLAAEGNAALLPQGLATPDMLLMVGVLDDGRPIGHLWIGLRHPRGVPHCAFVYDIEVAPEHQGAGHGRALLTAGEEVARAHGAEALELNVFGGNARAIALYSSHGYRVVSQQMRKDLSP
ncbi:GNAT family N-acetyltransferase [Blastococcus litoris]|uniref:GNAT family N-acetyltransferase n=1 Tax=Blastococcus litoris TaxID=2171622 RepID=UPI000E30B1A0|nr:GNAT family N-acetyltransferase [Blastococcus litoris]